MAVSMSAGELRYRLFIKYKDIANNLFTYSDYVLLGSLANEAALVTAAATLLGHVDAATNAQIVLAELVSETPYTASGQKGAPVSAQQSLRANKAVFNFTANNPLRNGFIHTPFIVPAYVQGTSTGIVQGVPPALAPAQADAAAIISWMQAQGAFRYTGDGIIYPAGNFDATESGVLPR